MSNANGVSGILSVSHKTYQGRILHAIDVICSFLGKTNGGLENTPKGSFCCRQVTSIVLLPHGSINELLTQNELYYTAFSFILF